MASDNQPSTTPPASSEQPTAARPPRRRRRQFSLRTLLLAMLVLGVLFGLSAIRLQRARRQAAAVATIRALGGEVYYDFEGRYSGEHPGLASPTPEFLLARLGPDFFHEVVEVLLPDENVPTAPNDLERCWGAISQLKQLQGIQVYGDWISDTAMAEISRHQRLRHLFIRGAGLRDHELKPLSRLKSLEMLALDNNPIGDVGASYLFDFPKLKSIGLSETQVGDQGIANIVTIQGIESLYLSKTRVTDAGMFDIAKLLSLKIVTLGETQITDAGIERLAALTQLRSLELERTWVTGTGFRKFSPDSQITRIMLSQCPVDDAGVKTIARFRRLKHFSIRESTASVTMASLGAVEWPETLCEIALDESGLTNEGLMRLADCPDLLVVSVRQTQVTPEGIKQFQQAKPTAFVLGQ